MLFRIRGLLIVALITWFGSSAATVRAADEPAAKAESAESTWYVAAVVSGRAGYRVTHYWSRGANMRSQTMVGIHPITTIVRGDRYWVYDELLNAGIVVIRSPLAVAADRTRDRPFANDLEKLIAAHGEQIETGKLNGIPAETWRATTSVGRRKVWVTAGEPKVPLRVENYDRESGESAVLNYSNWANGFDLPAQAFEPPLSFKVQELSYADYVAKSAEGLVGPVPVLHPTLLHGPRPR